MVMLLFFLLLSSNVSVSDNHLNVVKPIKMLETMFVKQQPGMNIHFCGLYSRRNSTSGCGTDGQFHPNYDTEA
ncbi:hypothetical protein PGT21_018130 [Puccinia graminis f. sp. tritici]|uniref:Uncharacterized protein n=1 Tax=Puccinia graminis f. sp. tritici TaxID=56615 RepID=A0A5B0M4M1_PUCGR|nr:hypothetical protein PGT21_018130 [Puccinia graminis f. sp. tritici]